MDLMKLSQESLLILMIIVFKIQKPSCKKKLRMDSFPIR